MWINLGVLFFGLIQTSFLGASRVKTPWERNDKLHSLTRWVGCVRHSRSAIVRAPNRFCLCQGVPKKNYPSLDMFSDLVAYFMQGLLQAG